MSLEWLKHAFAVGPAAPFEPTQPQRELVDRLCREIVARRLTTPALLFLESVSPLGFLTGQALQFFEPCLTAFGGAQACEQFATMLEHRGSIDWLSRRLEEIAREQAPRSG